MMSCHFYLISGLTVLLFLSEYTIPEAASATLTVNYTGVLQQASTISLDLTILESSEASGRKCEYSALNSVIKHVHVWILGFYMKLYMLVLEHVGTY